MDAQQDADLAQGDDAVCIVGMGYVGLTLAVALCEVGVRVHGVERNPAIVAALQDGRAHFVENGLAEPLARHVRDGRLTCGLSLDDARACTVYIVTVGTPLTPGRKANLQALQDVAADVARVLAEGDLVILRSTVRVGVSRTLAAPALDRAGVSYDLAYCPERTAEGRALLELRTLPQIVSGSSAQAAARAARFFGRLTPIVHTVSSLETAEMIKLVNNTQRDYLFAFANEVAGICQAMRLSATEVLEVAADGYARAVAVRPGPVGGPCLEKDPHILAESAALFGGEAPLSLHARKVNEDLPMRTAAQMAAWFRERRVQPKSIVIAGLAFKGRPATSDLRGSLVRPLIAELRAHFPGARITGYDPEVFEQEARELGIDIAATLETAVVGCDLLIFQTNHLGFQGLDWAATAGAMAPGGLVFDYWDQFGPTAPRQGAAVTYVSLGFWNSADA